MNNEKILDISWGTILKISLAIIFLYILYLIRDILIWFIFALIISILFNPAVNFLRKFRIPRVLADIFVYLGFFGLFVILVWLTVPMFISEVKQFSQFLPQYFEKISLPLQEIGIRAFEDIESFVNLLGGTLEKVAANILNILFLVFGGILTTFFVITIAFFLSLEEKKVEETFTLFFPKEYETYALSLWKRCQKKVSGWFLSRLLACLFVGIASFFAFLIFKVKYSFSLALLAGLLNFIPYVGPAIAGLSIFLIVSFDSLFKVVFVLIVFILIQQIENNILTPILSKKFIGLSPALVLISLAIGGKLWGVLGAILAVPIAGILFEFLTEFLKKRKKEETTTL